MKILRSDIMFTIAIGRLAFGIVWPPNLSLFVSLAPKTRPWWSFRRGYIITGAGSR